MDSLPFWAGVCQALAAILRLAVEVLSFYRWRKTTMTTTSAEPMIDAREIARLLGMTPKAVLVLAQQGRIPCVRISRKTIRFRESEVLKAVGR